MKFNAKFALRVLMAFAIMDMCFLMAGCSTSWVTEATGIIGALIPAVQGILTILAGFGVKTLSPGVMTAVQQWGQTAQSDLQNVVLPLINQYNTAEASAQPGILGEIEAAMQTVTNGLQQILPALKVSDPTTQAKVDAIVTEVSDELQAVLNLIPVIKGSPTPAMAMRALAEKPEAVAKLKSEKQFKHDYNAKAAEFGEQYKNWIR